MEYSSKSLTHLPIVKRLACQFWGMCTGCYFRRIFTSTIFGESEFQWNLYSTIFSSKDRRFKSHHQRNDLFLPIVRGEVKLDWILVTLCSGRPLRDSVKFRQIAPVEVSWFEVLDELVEGKTWKTKKKKNYRLLLLMSNTLLIPWETISSPRKNYHSMGCYNNQIRRKWEPKNQKFK